MTVLSRRELLGAGAAIAATTSLPIEAQAKERRYGDLRDIKHVVVVMQENRSFDHYFGSLKGVRGFGDRATILLPGGKAVWEQPQTPTLDAPTQYPWPLSGTDQYSGSVPPTAEIGAANYPGTSHSWEDQHGAWYGGLMNGWWHAKGGPTTLGFLRRADLPFHYALADAYTIGDAYHCSVLSATGPNRTYHWGGSINASQQFGSTVAYGGGDELGRFLPWEAYGETLQNVGVTWHVYQCADDYGDNGMEYFAAFANLDPTQGGTAAPGNPLYDNGVANVSTDQGQQTTNADDLAAAIRADVVAGTLPQVSWVVNNQFFSEHPVTAPSNGAYFLNALLNALNADPEVFDSTLVILNFDENDGQFDHVPPPSAPQGEFDEFYDSGTLTSSYGVTAALPVGFGFRVPLILISPWTRGGWVTSETADHTSVLQFLEKWTTAIGKPAICPNISAWRRQVAGDLLNAFDFDAPVYGLPQLPDPGPLTPETRYTPLPGDNVMPTQEPGRKPARPLPFQPNANLVDFNTDASGNLVAVLALSNIAPFVTKASHFAVYNNLGGAPTYADYPAAFPRQYTVPAGRAQSGTGIVGASAGDTAYDITVVGPNRFLRRYIGNVEGAGTHARVEATYYDAENAYGQGKLKLSLHNDSRSQVTFTIAFNNYSSRNPQRVTVEPRGHEPWVLDGAGSEGWYDVTVTVSSDSGWSQRLTGHLETGRPSITG
ncbi:MAG: phospholipase C, phosphocholine-specific [Polyangiaceae bacterium]|nr:phospholipase C, phosphocholine-specific [Polyangiaceae bacterium]